MSSTNPPRPPSASLGEVLGMARSGPGRLDTLTRIARLRGDVVRLGVPGLPGAHWLVSDADAARHVLVERQKAYPKSDMYRALEPLVGLGLVTSEGDLWRRQRRLAQPAFHKPRIAEMAATMTGAAEEVAEQWSRAAETGEVVDLQTEMTRLTLTIATRTLFGTDLGEDLAPFGEALTRTLAWADHMTSRPIHLPASWPTRKNRRFREALARLDAIVWKIIERRRTTDEPGEDLLGMLLSARDAETGEGMSDRQLRDEVMTLLLAGHETTANTLSWAFQLLATHPEALRRLHAELDVALEGRTPVMADLARLPYTARVVDEALRLYPPAWAIERQVAVDDDVLAGYPVPHGTRVTISIFTIHRNPRYWEAPEVFDPDRFLPERSEGRPKHAFIPFGAGPRQCMGNHFALAEAPLVLATLAARFSPVLVPGHVVAPDPVLTLRPLGGVPVTLHTRRPSPARRAA